MSKSNIDQHKRILKLIKQKRRDFAKAADEVNRIKDELKELKSQYKKAANTGETSCQTQTPNK